MNNKLIIFFLLLISITSCTSNFNYETSLQKWKDSINNCDHKQFESISIGKTKNFEQSCQNRLSALGKLNFEIVGVPKIFFDSLMIVNLNLKNDISNENKQARLFLLKDNLWKIWCIDSYDITYDCSKSYLCVDSPSVGNCERSYLELNTVKLNETHDYNFDSIKTFSEEKATLEVRENYPNLPAVNVNALVQEQKKLLMIKEVTPLCEFECTKTCSSYKVFMKQETQVSDNSYTCLCYCNNIDVAELYK